MMCPKCGNRLYVAHTTDKEAYVKRTRYCKACTYTALTREAIPAESRSAYKSEKGRVIHV